MSGVVRAAKEQFGEVNHDVFANPRFSVSLGDGRNYLLATKETYDVILTESVHPIYAGNASLYTKNYFESCRNKLSNNGVVSVWLPIYRLSQKDVATVLRSFQSVFPHSSVWFTSNSLSRQVLLIGTKSKASLDVAEWVRRVNAPHVQKDLQALNINDPYTLLSFLLMGENDIRRFAANAPFHTDNYPILEYSAPKSLDDLTTWKSNLTSLVAAGTTAPLPLFSCNDTMDYVKHYLPYKKASLHILMGIVQHFDTSMSAISEYRQALQVNQFDKTTVLLLEDVRTRYVMPKLNLMYQLQKQGQTDKALQIGKYLLLADPGNILIVPSIAKNLAKAGYRDSAFNLLNKTKKEIPQWAEGYLTQGVILLNGKLFKEARAAFDTALSIDPLLAEAYSSRSIALTALQEYTAALIDLHKAIELSPSNPTPYENRAYVLLKMGNNATAQVDLQMAKRLRN